MKVTVLTLWDSMAAIQRFTGADATAAVVEPEAQALLTRFDACVEHFDVLVDARSSTSPSSSTMARRDAA